MISVFSVSRAWRRRPPGSPLCRTISVSGIYGSTICAANCAELIWKQAYLAGVVPERHEQEAVKSDFYKQREKLDAESKNQDSP